MSTKIILVGPSCAGKDTLRKKLQEKGYSYGKLHTTRPKRPGEDDEYLWEDIPEGSIPEYSNIFSGPEFLFCFKFGRWFYALSRKEWEENNLFIFSPPYFTAFPEAKNSFIIYLNPGPAECLRRAGKRGGDKAEMWRRFQSDFFLFQKWEEEKEYTIKI